VFTLMRPDLYNLLQMCAAAHMPSLQAHSCTPTQACVATRIDLRKQS
jgi:hypothetical protein